MAFKFIAAFALVAVVSAGYIPAQQVYHAAPAAVVKTVAEPIAHYSAQPILTKADNEFDPHPQYKFGYDVQDAVSGDSKSQVEERDGDAVRGEYSLIDADGFKRTVQYTADDEHGFNAVVQREPLVKTVTAIKTVATPLAYAAPAHHGAHYAASAVVKSVVPAYTTYSHPTAVVKSAPVVHFAAAPAYTTYSAPASFVSHR